MKTVDKIKSYYHKAASTDWARYMLYIITVIGILVLLYIFLFKNKYARTVPGRVYTVHNAKGVVIDKRYFYTIGNNCVGKYDRKSGKKVLLKKLPFKHLSGGTFVNGDLVIVNNPSNKPSNNALVWLNPETLDIIDIMPLPQVQGSLSWIDWAWDKWWVCDAHYKKHVKETSIYCFNQEWTLEGYWKLPKEVIKEIEPHSLSGGAWFGEHLCVTGYDKPEMYILDLPEHDLHAKLLKTVQTCFDGQGFAFERGKGNVYAWGTRRDDNKVVRCALDLETTEE